MLKRAFLILAFLLMVGERAEAHTVTEVGDFVIIAAWENEPPVIGQWNTIVVDILGADGTIDPTDITLRQFELVNGDTTRAAAPSESFSETVRYEVSFIPTAVGDTGARLVGTFGGESVDIIVFPERVEPANIVQFPDVELSNGDLQSAIIRMEEQMAAQRTQLIISYVVAGVGVLLGGGGVYLARRS